MPTLNTDSNALVIHAGYLGFPERGSQSNQGLRDPASLGDFPSPPIHHLVSLGPTTRSGIGMREIQIVTRKASLGPLKRDPAPFAESMT